MLLPNPPAQALTKTAQWFIFECGAQGTNAIVRDVMVLHLTSTVWERQIALAIFIEQVSGKTEDFGSLRFVNTVIRHVARSEGQEELGLRRFWKE